MGQEDRPPDPLIGTLVSGKMLTPTEVHRRLRVGRTTAYRMLKDGTLPGVVRLGTSFYRIPEDRLEEWIAAGGLPADKSASAPASLPVHQDEAAL